MLPGLAQAVGLGAIEVNSRLNQPLDANIRLLSLRNASLNDINAVLASSEQFERVHLERSPVMALLNFEVSKDKYGRPIVHVYSKEPITDPYIQILLDVKWPQGQLLRAYNILLDPVDYASNAEPQTKFGATEPKLELASKAEKKVVVAEKKQPKQVTVASQEKPAKTIVASPEKATKITETPALEQASHLAARELKTRMKLAHSNNQINDADPELNEVPDVTDKDVLALERNLDRKPAPKQIHEHQIKISNLEKSPLLNSQNIHSMLDNALRAELALSAEKAAITREENEILQKEVAMLESQQDKFVGEVQSREGIINTLKLEITKLGTLLTQRDKTIADQAYQLAHPNGVLLSYKLLLTLLILSLAGSSALWYFRRNYALDAFTPTVEPEASSIPAEPQATPTASKQEATSTEPKSPAPVVTPSENKAKVAPPAVTFSNIEQSSKAEADFSQIDKDGTIEFEAGLYDKSKLESNSESVSNDPSEAEISPHQKKLKLAEQHITLHDFHEAYKLLTEIIDEGDEVLAKQAQTLLDQMQR